MLRFRIKSRDSRCQVVTIAYPILSHSDIRLLTNDVRLLTNEMDFKSIDFVGPRGCRNPCAHRKCHRLKVYWLNGFLQHKEVCEHFRKAIAGEP